MELLDFTSHETEIKCCVTDLQATGADCERHKREREGGKGQMGRHANAEEHGSLGDNVKALPNLGQARTFKLTLPSSSTAARPYSSMSTSSMFLLSLSCPNPAKPRPPSFTRGRGPSCICC